MFTDFQVLLIDDVTSMSLGGSWMAIAQSLTHSLTNSLLMYADDLLVISPSPEGLQQSKLIPKSQT